MSLQSDILAAFKKQAAKLAATDTPEASQVELSTDLAAAISSNAGSAGTFVNVAAVGTTTALSTGLTTLGFVAPSDWNGKKIVQYWCNCPAGTGSANIQINKNGSTNTATMVVESNATITTGANVTLATGDVIRLNITVNTSGLQGLFATFKIT